MRRILISTLLSAGVAAASVAPPATAAEVALVCSLVSEEALVGREGPPKEIQEQFIVKFDDVRNKITYFMSSDNKFVSNVGSAASLSFEVDGPPGLAPGGGFIKYWGLINRFTGTIWLHQLYRDKDGNIVNLPSPLRKKGTCKTSARKFRLSDYAWPPRQSSAQCCPCAY
jgi:hypothetical protein